MKSHFAPKPPQKARLQFAAAHGDKGLFSKPNTRTN